MFANDPTDKGNVKIFISDDRLIYKIYPYHFFDQEYKHNSRCKDRKESSSEKMMINAYAKKMKVLGYGLCNDWQYFWTGTIDPKVYTASSFDEVSKLISKQFYTINKKYDGVKYIFILEKHKNGNYHAHGLCNLPGSVINPNPCYIDSYGKKIRPSKSNFIQYGIDQNYYNLGLNTLSPIIDRGSVADYCIKYMVKMMESGSKFANTIFHSKGLKSFNIEYGCFIGDDFPSVLNVSTHNVKFGINNIYEYQIKHYGNIKEITLQLK